MPPSRAARATLVALTPEAKVALGGAEVGISTFPFRIGRDSRGRPRPAPRTVRDRRKPASQRSNELYLEETTEPFQVSRQHLQIQRNGTRYVLVDRESTCGTIVEGTSSSSAPPRVRTSSSSAFGRKLGGASRPVGAHERAGDRCILRSHAYSWPSPSADARRSPASPRPSGSPGRRSVPGRSPPPVSARRRPAGSRRLRSS